MFGRVFIKRVLSKEMEDLLTVAIYDCVWNLDQKTE